MIAKGHPEVSVERRCQLLGVARATYYRGLPSGLRQGDRELMKRIDQLIWSIPIWEVAPLSTKSVRLMLLLGVVESDG